MFSLVLAAGMQAAAAAAPGVTHAQAAASLQGRAQCVAFDWIADGAASPRAAITVPVTINGTSMPLQLDTGSDATMLYGRVADRAGWAGSAQRSFRAADFAIGSTTVDRPKVYVHAEMEADARLAGTLGLPELVGRVAVIDYPRQRFCLFAEADLPPPLANATYVRADLRHAKFFVPVSVGAYRSDAMIFDTGSSQTPLSVDLATWTRLTDRTGVAEAPAVIKGSAWGKPITLSGAPAARPMMLGKLDLGHPLVFTNADNPTEFAEWPFRADGVLGNAALWDGIVILDLTANMRLGFVR